MYVHVHIPTINETVNKHQHTITIITKKSICELDCIKDVL